MFVTKSLNVALKTIRGSQTASGFKLFWTGATIVLPFMKVYRWRSMGKPAITAAIPVQNEKLAISDSSNAASISNSSPTSQSEWNIG
jgi:fatty acid/phospholipid biosynthesis enzyme